MSFYKPGVTFHDPLLMYTIPPCDYKRRRRAPLKGIVTRDVGRDHPDTSTTLSARYWHSPLSASPLAETWELPSLSRLACTPYYRHLRCKIIQCPCTPPCWTYGPVAGTRINPCITVLPLASTSGTRKHAAFTSWDPDPRVRAPTQSVYLCRATDRQSVFLSVGKSYTDATYSDR